ncbi:MAG: hypothetical protein IAF58_19900 [Leptolyngbya sp.]|nr:hypothetical protein [Candidatus Melainabacteria bacterium]
MKRYAQDRGLMSRRRKFFASFSHGGTVDSGGRFRKRKPLDCGRTQCKLCHGEKLFNRPSVKDVRADEQFNQMLQN